MFRPIESARLSDEMVFSLGSCSGDPVGVGFGLGVAEACGLGEARVRGGVVGSAEALLFG